MSIIFLSHSSKDDAIASSLESWLRREGHSAVFVDHSGTGGLLGGELWDERLFTELRRCRALIALVSRDWLRSRWCIAEANHAQALKKAIIPIQIGDPTTDTEFAALLTTSLPPALARIQGLSWHGSDAEMPRLKAALTAAGLNDAFEWNGQRPPFPGLSTFEMDDASVFYGREQEITELLALLAECRAPRRARLVVIQGVSGAGKSSLLRAGVLARIRMSKGAWIVLPPLRPLRDPLAELESLFSLVLGAATPVPPARPRVTEADTSNWPFASAEFEAYASWLVLSAAKVREQSGALDATVLLAVDQLEDAVGGLTTQGAVFLAVIRKALALSDHRFLAIATLRSDSIGPFDRHPALARSSSAHDILPMVRYQLAPVSRQSIHRVIEGPAERVGLTWEAGLVNRMVDEAQSDDALPLLAFALRALWEKHGKEKLHITTAHYEAFGGIAKSVGQRASEIYDGWVRDLQLEGNSQPAIEARIQEFRSLLLVELAEFFEDGRLVRKPARRSQVTECIEALIDDFVDGRIFVQSAETLEVAHDAIYRQWHTLAQWRRAAGELLPTLRRVREERRAWDASQNDRDLLPEGSLLDSGTTLVSAGTVPVDDTTRTFIERSLDKLRRSKSVQKRFRLGAYAGGIVAAILAVVAAFVAKNSIEQRDRALVSDARALSLVGQRVMADGDPTTGLLLGLEAAGKLPPATKATEVPEVADNLYRGWQSDAERIVLALPRDKGDELNDVAISPDGKKLLACAGHGEAFYIDIESRKTLATLKVDSHLYRGRFDPDGREAVLSTLDGGLVVWNLETGASTVPYRHRGYVMSADYSPDGQRIVGIDNSGVGFIFEKASGTTKALNIFQRGWGKDAAFSPDGQWVVTVSESGVHVWSADGVLRKVTAGRQMSYPTSAVFSPDSRRLLVTDGNAMLVWDLQSDKIVRRFETESGDFINAQFIKNGEEIIVAVGQLFSQKTYIERWDVIAGLKTGELTGHAARIEQVAATDDGAIIATASADGTLRIWLTSGETGEVSLAGVDGVLGGAFMDPLGKLVVAMDSTKQPALWDLSSGRRIGSFEKFVGAITEVAFDANASRVLVASDQGETLIWDTANGKALSELKYHGNPILAGEFDLKGERVVTASSEGVVVWDAGTGNPLAVLDEFPSEVVWAGFVPGKDWVMTTTMDKAVSAWSIERTPRLMLKIEGFEFEWVKLVRFDATGSHAALISPEEITNNNLLYLVDLNGIPRGIQPKALEGHGDNVRDAAFSPDGKRLASVSDDRTVITWSVPDGAKVIQEGHQGSVGKVAFSGDGTEVLSVAAEGFLANDGSARLWNSQTGEHLSTYKRPGATLLDAAFVNATHMVRTISSRGKVLSWPRFETLEPLVADLKTWVPRCLTGIQRLEYSLGPEPPRWCIEQAKWPYTSASWKKWLADKDAGLSPETPDD